MVRSWGDDDRAHGQLRIAAVLAFGNLLQKQHIGPSQSCLERGCAAGQSRTDDDNLMLFAFAGFREQGRVGNTDPPEGEGARSDADPFEKIPSAKCIFPLLVVHNLFLLISWIVI